MKGWLVINGFLISDKFNKLYELFVESATRHGVELKVIKNSELVMDTHYKFPTLPDFVIFYDKDILLARTLESMGIPVFNNHSAIQISDSKADTALTLMGKIPMPRTIISPMTYQNIGFTDYIFLNYVETVLTYPFVLKEAYGSFGHEVKLIMSHEELLKTLKDVTTSPLVFQEYIRESHGQDIRLYIVGDKCVAGVKRKASDGDFRANVTNGGTMTPYNPTKGEEKLALETTKLLGLDFAGVDILLGHDEPLLCEVNSNAHFYNLLITTGFNFADSIIDYVIAKI